MTWNDMACRVPSDRLPNTCRPSEISGRPMAWVFRSPDMEFARSEGFPLTTMVGTPVKAVCVTEDSTVGSNDDAVASHAPSMKRIVLPPIDDKADTDGSNVTEDVRLCRSTINGSRGFGTPRT